MAKTATQYVCQSCGAVSAKWSGRCDGCGEWNSLSEEAYLKVVPGKAGALPKGKQVKLVGLQGESEAPARVATGICELDLVAGGGFVPGSALLVGGDPGIGKSTLLLQAMAALARAGRKVVYISGEEAIAQVRLRAERLGLADAPVMLAVETNISDILATLSAGPAPDAVVIDSIQTMWSPQIDSAPGTVSQVRTITEALIRFSKQHGTALAAGGPCDQGRANRRPTRYRTYGRYSFVL